MAKLLARLVQPDPHSPTRLTHSHPGPRTTPVAELAALGVKRVSVGGAFAFAAYGAAVEAAGELLSQGTYGFIELSAAGAKAAHTAFAV